MIKGKIHMIISKMKKRNLTKSTSFHVKDSQNGRMWLLLSTKKNRHANLSQQKALIFMMTEAIRFH
jgi:hypothetical protein